MLVKDIIPAFELFQPTTVDDAVALAAEWGDDGWLLGGGNDSYSWFKDRAKRPQAVIDLTGIADLHGIREVDGGLEIGAITTLTEIANSPLVQAKFRVLSDAARKVASPQIRNSGTVGGTVAQDARCWYYRGGLPCYRAGGNTCYADTPEGINRDHTLWGADRCVAVTPSDVAPALVALDAKMVIRNEDGEEVVDAAEFFIGPNVDITRMTVLEPGDVLTAIRIPADWAGAKFYFEKVADRDSWDFPLVNVAAAIVVNGGVVERSRICAGGVQCIPRRMQVAEGTIAGQAVTPELAQLAGQAETRGARPLNHNHFKVPLLANLVMRAIRDAA